MQIPGGMTMRLNIRKPAPAKQHRARRSAQHGGVDLHAKLNAPPQKFYCVGAPSAIAFAHLPAARRAAPKEGTVTHKYHGDSLAEDLPLLLALTDRRRFCKTVAGAALLPLVGCGSSAQTASSGSNSAGGTSTGEISGAADPNTAAISGTCAHIPEETAGPYPGDGSNGSNALTLDGIVRADIRPNFAGVSGRAEGIPLTVILKMVSVSSGCAQALSRAVYIWHCDRAGAYSLYGNAASQNYLRGVQATNSQGLVTFQTIFPACYSGRWPHIHFEIFADANGITSASNKTTTSQLALPAEACNTVYATTGYSASVSNFSSTSLASDNVFKDGATLQLPTITGSPDAGFTATLQVAV